MRWLPFFWFPTGTATIAEGALGPDDLPLIQPSSRTSISEFSPCFNDIAL